MNKLTDKNIGTTNPQVSIQSLDIHKVFPKHPSVLDIYCLLSHFELKTVSISTFNMDQTLRIQSSVIMQTLYHCNKRCLMEKEPAVSS